MTTKPKNPVREAWENAQMKCFQDWENFLKQFDNCEIVKPLPRLFIHKDWKEDLRNGHHKEIYSGERLRLKDWSEDFKAEFVEIEIKEMG